VFLDEGNDAISFPPAGPAHTHLPTGAVTLGTVAPPSCPTVRKYAYLTAVAPAATESAANPVALAFRAATPASASRPAASTYTVTAPGGQVFGPFSVAATPAVGAPGAFDHLADLRRDGATAVPPIGVPGAVQEGVFTVTFTARDRLGQAASGRALLHLPALRSADEGRAAGPRGGALLHGPHPARRLQAREHLHRRRAHGRTTERHRARRRPRSLDPECHARSGLRHALRAPTAGANRQPHLPHPPQADRRALSLGPTCDPLAGPLDPLCGSAFVPALPTDAVRTNQPMTVPADGPPRVNDGWVPFVGVFEVTTTGVTDAAVAPCTGCDPDEYEIMPGVRRAVVIGLRGFPDLRPESPGPYAELTTIDAAPPNFRSVTSSYAGVDSERCTRWVAFGPNANPSCREITTYEQHRFVASAGLTLAPVSPANATVLEARWSSAAKATFSAGSSSSVQHARNANTHQPLCLVDNGELTMKRLVLILASALAGALIVVACSDDSPTPADADAGACNCPAGRAADHTRTHASR
jgi:hypothetical protein